VTRAGVNAAGLIAACLLLLAPFDGQHATALAASASALALLTAAVALYAQVVPLAGPTGVIARGKIAAARSSSLDSAFLPQRDPDAAGKPRPRAPGANPPAV
jgi:hypothetical protein